MSLALCTTTAWQNAECLFAVVTGKKVNYVQLPSDKYKGSLTGHGVPSILANAIDDMWSYVSEFGCESIDLRTTSAGSDINRS